MKPCLAVVLALVLAASAVPAPATAAARPPHPALTLPRDRQSGADAVRALGDRLPDVAAALGLAPDALRHVLLGDPSAQVDRTGHLFFAEPLPARDPAARARHAAAAAALADTPLPAPLSHTFKLHSKADAPRRIYLDFDGAVLQDTVWNNGGGPIVAPGFDLDGDPGTFSNAERRRIQYIWQRVAEDFAPFDIDVTTQPPPPQRLTRLSLADTEYGMTVLVTRRDAMSMSGCGCAGIAYVGVFDAVGDYFKPALVFWDQLTGGDEKDVAEAISHEAGHTLGLSHDGTSTVGTYAGQGTGPTGWAPIMGVGYDEPLVQWSRGQYADANNLEDDLAIIQAHGGTLRADDHGDTLAAATPLDAVAGAGTTALSGAGIIETRTDVDVFSFHAGAGPATFTVNVDARSPDLDVRLVLTDATGAIVSRTNPQGVLGASLAVHLRQAGTYYLTIDGMGEGHASVTGYSDYGSLGQYRITGTVTAP